MLSSLSDEQNQRAAASTGVEDREPGTLQSGINGFGEVYSTPRGNEVALVVIDHKSKWLLAYPLKNKSSLAVANTLGEKIVPSLVKKPKAVLNRQRD